MEALVRRLREAQRGESKEDLQRHQARRVPVGIRNHQMRATTSHQERRQGLQAFLRPPEERQERRKRRAYRWQENQTAYRWWVSLRLDRDSGRS